MYPVQLEDRIHWIIATLSFKNAYKARSLPAFGKSDHAAIFLTPKYKQMLIQEPPVERVVMRWSSHSEAMLQAALDDIDWEMFPGEFIWHQRVHGCSIKLCQHANRASYWNSNYKDILKSETVGEQNNPCCG